MKITFVKGSDRNQLICQRSDGWRTRADLGPGLPMHDLAHYVVEKYLGLEKGFFGNIKSGMTIQELSDKEIIKTLGPESWLSEVMARNIQALMSSASTEENYMELVRWEADVNQNFTPPDLTVDEVRNLKVQFGQLYAQWMALMPGEKLILEF